MRSESYEEIIERCQAVLADINRKDFYADILYDSSSLTRIVKSRTEESFLLRPKLEGFVVRGYKGGQWREYGLQSLETLDEVIEKLKKMNSPPKKPVILHEFEGWHLNTELTGKIPPSEIPILEKAEAIRTIYTKLQAADARVINPVVVYYDSLLERIFVNNEGCALRQKIPRVRIFIQPIVKQGSRIEFDYMSEGGEIGFELLEKITDEKLQEVVANSIALLRAEKAPSGNMPVIVDPDMAGLIAHESFGHGLEADQILRDRSYLKNYIGRSVASKICNIVDSPIIEGQLGSFLFDDEGIRTKKTKLVENGILRNVLHDRYTASAMNLPPGGNGRRESYAHKLHVRMTNTYFEAGDWELETMLQDIKFGVMLVRGYFGMEDPIAGGMQVTSKKGFLIENGEQTKLLTAITLSGYVLDVLKSIDAVSKGPVNFRGGTCGKGHEDYVPVTTGGVYLRAQQGVVSPG